MAQKKLGAFLDKVPTLFWGILLVALILGLIIAFTSFQMEKRQTSLNVDDKGPLYTYNKTVEQAPDAVRRNFLGIFTGTWIARQDGVEMVIDFSRSNIFVMRVIREDIPFIVFAAHGKYGPAPTTNKDGKLRYNLIMSERRDTRLPLIRPNTYTKFRNLDVRDSLFDWRKSGETLALSVSSAPENFTALFEAFAGPNSKFVQFERFQ